MNEQEQMFEHDDWLAHFAPQENDDDWLQHFVAEEQLTHSEI